MLIEAKVNAVEHNNQCDRLAALWANEQPTLVFLTRTGEMPEEQAPATCDRWHPLTWTQVADLVSSTDPAGGALDFLHTIRAFQAGRGDEVVTLDNKTAFYLRHRADIEEWAALRESGLIAVESALRHALDEMDVPKGAVFGWEDWTWPTFSLRRAHWRSGASVVAVAIQWSPSMLLSGKWPYVGVRVTGDLDPQLASWLRRELADRAVELQWGEKGEMRWPLWRRVPPRGEGVDLEELAADCQAALMTGWQIMSPALDQLFKEASQP